jgi:hypothetical protein
MNRSFRWRKKRRRRRKGSINWEDDKEEDVKYEIEKRKKLKRGPLIRKEEEIRRR